MLRARPATAEDADTLLAWRNDPETVASSLHPQVVSAAEHRHWLGKALADPHRALRIVVESLTGAEAGTYRLDNVGGDDVEVSLTVAPAHRGRGLSTPIIQLAARHAMRLGALRVVAVIRDGNLRSRRAFSRAGFVRFHDYTAQVVRYDAIAKEIAAFDCALCASGTPHHTNAGGSIGGSDRAPRLDLHERDDRGGVGLCECDAGDLWLAWERARAAMTGSKSSGGDGARRAGPARGSTPRFSTTAATAEP